MERFQFLLYSRPLLAFPACRRYNPHVQLHLHVIKNQFKSDEKRIWTMNKSIKEQRQKVAGSTNGIGISSHYVIFTLQYAMTKPEDNFCQRIERLFIFCID